MTGHSGACTFHADSPREAFRRLATVMGADEGVRPGEAMQVMAEGIDLLVQIGLRDEVRRVTDIVQVKRHGHALRFSHVWRYADRSSQGMPVWEQRPHAAE